MISGKRTRAINLLLHQEAAWVQLSDLENELKESIPAIKDHIVEDSCGTKGQLLRIYDSFVTGFYKCEDLSL